jgi:hypothetical protein
MARRQQDILDKEDGILGGEKSEIPRQKIQVEDIELGLEDEPEIKIKPKVRKQDASRKRKAT